MDTQEGMDPMGTDSTSSADHAEESVESLKAQIEALSRKNQELIGEKKNAREKALNAAREQEDYKKQAELLQQQLEEARSASERAKSYDDWVSRQVEQEEAGLSKDERAMLDSLYGEAPGDPLSRLDQIKRMRMTLGNKPAAGIPGGYGGGPIGVGDAEMERARQRKDYAQMLSIGTNKKK